jgi:uncharacterized heparinase superfamily protein
MYAKAALMISWLKNMYFNSGNMAILNDSAAGIVPVVPVLLRYADQLHVPTINVSLSESNYRIFRTQKYTAIIDVGGIAPVYQPGHTHADTFSFVMEITEKPFIVDTGCSTYELGTIRMSERGTAAHNTVTVDASNSSQVWASHRIAKRAQVTILEDSPHKIRAQHDGYIRKIHVRTFIQHDQSLEIIDEIKGEGKLSKNTARFHLDNSIEHITIQGNTVIIVDTNTILLFDGASQVNITVYEQAIGFNKRVNATCICVDFTSILKTYINYETPFSYSLFYA